ncbi:MAG: hypothetical protein L0312_17000, partial [Acidobacteria bacterium]|nr:hypothetical protein [Acidobacteriota bacterium]
HRAVANFIYDLPFGMGQGRQFNSAVLEKTLGGWQLSSFWIAETGRPLSIGVSSNLAGSFAGQRANIDQEDRDYRAGLNPIPYRIL